MKLKFKITMMVMIARFVSLFTDSEMGRAHTKFPHLCSLY